MARKRLLKTKLFYRSARISLPFPFCTSPLPGTDRIAGNRPAFSPRRHTVTRTPRRRSLAQSTFVLKYHVNRRFPPCTTCIGRHDTEKFRSGFSFFQQNRNLLFSEGRRPQAPRHRLKPLACPPHKQQETERSERKASRHLRPENSKESNSTIISIFRFCDTNKCAGSGSPIKPVSSIHTHTHTHTHAPALPTFAQSFRAFHPPMPALFPSTTIRSYRCPQPIFENKRIRPAGRKYPENRTAT